MDLGKFDIECPECDTPISVSMADFAAHRTVRCRRGHAVALDEDERGTARKADKAMKDLDKAIGRLGGTIKF